MTTNQVHTVFTNIQSMTKLSKVSVEFNVNLSLGVTKATLAMTSDNIVLYTNEELDNGVAIIHRSKYFSSEHPSRDWFVTFIGNTMETMVSDLQLLFDELVNRRIEIEDILTKDYNQEIADLKNTIKQTENDILDIENKVFTLPD